MHRIIAERHGINLNGQLIDHRDGDGLNNQFNNLRVATQAQNQYNQGLAKNNKSGFKGVYWDKQYGKWRVLLRKSGETVLDRRFDNPLEAAKAYNKAAIEHFGEFARLNPV